MNYSADVRGVISNHQCFDNIFMVRLSFCSFTAVMESNLQLQQVQAGINLLLIFHQQVILADRSDVEMEIPVCADTTVQIIGLLVFFADGS